MISAYPLTWPVDYPRTKNPQRSKFKNSFAKGRDLIIAEVRRLGGRDLVISTNVPLKTDGYPYASGFRVTDHGAAAYFNYDGMPVVICCDKWNSVDDNIVAISKAIEAMRGIDRWGVSEMLKRAFTGFKSLPAASGKEWWVVLGVSPKASLDEIRSAYRDKAKKYHPDKPGGSQEKFLDLQQAVTEAEKNFV